MTQTVAPKIKSPYLKELQNRYYEGSIILNRWRAIPKDVTDADIERLIEATNAWESDTYKWISSHITPAAAERFQQWNPMPLMFRLPGQHSEDLNTAYENSLIFLPQWLANLDALMRSDEMYPQ